MPVRFAIAYARHGIEEAGKTLAVISPENETADMAENDHKAPRQDIDIGPAKRFALQIDLNGCDRELRRFIGPLP